MEHIVGEALGVVDAWLSLPRICVDPSLPDNRPGLHLRRRKRRRNIVGSSTSCTREKRLTRASGGAGRRENNHYRFCLERPEACYDTQNRREYLEHL